MGQSRTNNGKMQRFHEFVNAENPLQLSTKKSYLDQFEISGTSHISNEIQQPLEPINSQALDHLVQ